MNSKLHTLLEAAQELSPLEKLELISTLSESLRDSYLQVQSAQDFWGSKTLEQLIQAQQTLPISDIEELVADFWPEDESADDMIEYIYQQRREDRQES